MVSVHIAQGEPADWKQALARILERIVAGR
jgi:hypothetical protein